MKKIIRFILPSVFILTMLMAGCGANQQPPTSVIPEETATPVPTNTIAITTTPDLCAPDNIKAEVDKVHRHMREFNDASTLASSIPRDQLSTSIADLQRIRREAEDEIIPPCLFNLRKYEIDHMNAVIQTLIAFIQGSDLAVLDQGRAVAGQQLDQYILELARLLGLTPVPGTAVAVPSATPTP